MLMLEGPTDSESAEYGIHSHTGVDYTVGVDDAVDEGGRMYKEDVNLIFRQNVLYKHFQNANEGGDIPGDTSG